MTHLESAVRSTGQQYGEWSKGHSASGEGILKPALKQTTVTNLKGRHADVDVSYVPPLVAAPGGSK